MGKGQLNDMDLFVENDGDRDTGVSGLHGGRRYFLRASRNIEFHNLFNVPDWVQRAKLYTTDELNTGPVCSNQRKDSCSSMKKVVDCQPRADGPT